MTSLTLLFLFSTFSTSFQQPNFNTNDTLSTVISVGEIELSRGEYEYQYSLWLQQYVNKEQSYPSDKQIRDWKERFFNSSILLADAYNQGYFSMPDVNEQINSIEQYYLFRKNGVIYNKIFDKDLNLDWKHVYSLRDTVYKYEYFKIANDSINDTIISEWSIQTEPEFQKLKKDICHLKDVKCIENEDRWPFLNIWGAEKHLFNMEESTISSIIKTKNALYILYLKEKFFFEKEPFDQFKDNFPKIYSSIKRDWLYQEYNQEILTNVRFETLREKKENQHSFLFSHRDSLSEDEELAKYKMNEKWKTITVHDFLQFYENLLFKPSLESVTAVIDCLKQIAIQDYLLEKANSLRILNNEDYVILKRTIKNKTVLQKYIKSNFEQETIELDTLLSLYNSKVDEFIYPFSYELSYFEFGTNAEAFDFLRRITFENKIVIEDSILKEYNFKNTILSDTISLDKNHFLEPLKDLIFNSPSPSIGPIYYEEKNILIVRKSLLEKKTRPFVEVKSYLIDELIKLQRQTWEKQKADSLKENFEIIIYDMSLN